MAKPRKAILKKAYARNLKKASVKKRLRDGFRVPRKGDGMIHLEPREWGENGGFATG